MTSNIDKSNSSEMSQKVESMEAPIEQIPTRLPTAGLASADEAAELVLREMYEAFFAAFPPVDAKTTDVQKWILQWFAIEDTFMNDIAVPNFVSHLTISGPHLWTLSDKAILQYLAIQNVRIYTGTAGGMYEKEVIAKLAADIAKAKERAIPGWEGSCAASDRGDDSKAITSKVERLSSDEMIQNLQDALQNQVPEIDFSAFFAASSIEPKLKSNTLKEEQRKFIVTDDGDLVEIQDEEGEGAGPSSHAVGSVSRNEITTTSANQSQNRSRPARPFCTFAISRRANDESSESDSNDDETDSTSDDGSEPGDGDGKEEDQGGST